MANYDTPLLCVSEVLLDDTDTEHPLCKKYREELEQIKDEFERYRLRAQSVLKNKKVSLLVHGLYL